MNEGAGEATLQSVEETSRHSKAVIHTAAEGQAILFNPDNGCYYSLNPIGTEIWYTCDGTCSLRSVVDQVCAESDVARDRARSGLLELVDDLKREC